MKFTRTTAFAVVYSQGRLHLPMQVMMDAGLALGDRVSLEVKDDGRIVVVRDKSGWLLSKSQLSGKLTIRLNKTATNVVFKQPLPAFYSCEVCGEGVAMRYQYSKQRGAGGAAALDIWSEFEDYVQSLYADTPLDKIVAMGKYGEFERYRDDSAEAMFKAFAAGCYVGEAHAKKAMGIEEHDPFKEAV